MKMFSRPVSSWLKPAPSSSSAATRPCVTISPSVGCRMPATHLSSVDLPRAVVAEDADGRALLDVEVDVVAAP